MKLSDVDPQLGGTKVTPLPHELEARQLVAENFQAFGQDLLVIDKNAYHLAEVVVGIAHAAFIAGMAREAMRRPGQDIAHEAYLQGIEEGRIIERRQIDGYND